jgi:beta-glucosidase
MRSRPRPSILIAGPTIGSGRQIRRLLLTLLGLATVFAQSPDARVQSLVRRMTLDEKLSLVHGARDPRDLGQAGYWPGLLRLGIPPLRFADGSAGINVNRDATSMPAPVGLAATFDVEAARLYGVVLGRDAAALEQNVLLAPHVNIVRDPLFRRNHTALSEDPLLTAELAAAQVRGIQSEGVMAEVKHLAAYNGAQNVFVDERTLHEIYLPAFEAAVRAGAASAMCAYNKVNSEWACENGELQDAILRGPLGFRGFVTSDWGAVHSPAAITRGLDLEMPGREIGGRRGGPYFTDALKNAVESGAIPISAVDRSVTRILTQMARFGLLDRKQSGPRTIDIAADARIVRRIAAEGAVLLKNDANALPLKVQDLNSLVVIGPTAGQLAAGYMGERSYGFETRMVSPLSALRAAASPSGVSYSNGVDLTGIPIPGIPNPIVDAGTDYSWRGTLAVPAEGNYTFLVQPALDHGSEGGGSITLDGVLAARTGGPGFGGTGIRPRKWSSLLPTTDGRDNGRGTTVHLTAGPHKIELIANSIGDGPLRIRFAWITPELRRAGIEAAVRAARVARTAIVFAWCGTGSIDLPEDQNDLIAKVASVVPQTVIVLNTGGPVLMPWKDQVASIVEMWYPGQEGGWATADVLLGRVNPSGRLPVTFPKRLEDMPAQAAGHPERNAPPAPPGTSGTNPNAPAVTYSEGLTVGYRWYDQQELQPLFPFGHGLSYTRFEYSGLVVTTMQSGLEVTFTLRNAGRVRGSEVPQVYLGPPEHSPVPMPPRSLAAFRRVELDAGASCKVTVQIGTRALSYWSPERHDWVLAKGARPIYVGASSRDIRLLR